MKDEPNKTSIVIKVRKPSSENSVEGSSYESATEIIDKIRDELMSVVKIMTMSLIADEDNSVDFLSEYENYTKLYSVLLKCEIKDGSPSDANYFVKNIFKCWMDILSTAIIAIHALPDNKIFQCDVIGEKGNLDERSKNDSNSKSIGVCYTASFNIEAFDWKEHTVELFIPFDITSGLNTLYTVDGEAVLAC